MMNTRGRVEWSPKQTYGFQVPGRVIGRDVTCDHSGLVGASPPIDPFREHPTTSRFRKSAQTVIESPGFVSDPGLSASRSTAAASGAIRRRRETPVVRSYLPRLLETPIGSTKRRFPPKPELEDESPHTAWVTLG